MSRSRIVNGMHMIENRRKAEDAFRDMEIATANTRKDQLRTDFEISTTQKIERRTKQQMFEAKKKEYEENLLSRRRRLADLYNREMEDWKQEILSRVETVEDRKARIMQKAYALRDAREKARQEYVKERLNDQWRNACDDARTLDSKAMTLHMNEERVRQIREKMERKQQLSKQEGDFIAAWNRQMDEMEMREKEKEDHRRRVNKETSEAIRRQIEENERMKEEYYRNMRREEDEELERLRNEIEDEERARIRSIEEAHRRGREVMQDNIEFLKVREEEMYIEREQEAILLDYALRKERQAIAAEEAKKNADRQAALQYRKYLEEQMIKEAEDTAFVDEMRRREEEKVMKARDDMLKAREDARARLMKMVDEGRQEQIRYRQEEMRRERDEDSKFVKKFMDDASEAVRQEREERERRRRTNVENNEVLLKQLASQRQKEELIKQEEYLADKQMKYREKLHQQRLSEQAGVVRSNFPIQKNQWYS